MDEPTHQVLKPNSSRGRERLARILDAATQLFLKDGYGATSIDSILEVSGGSKATLYNYFPTKDDLFRAVIDEVMAASAPPDLDPVADAATTLTEFSVKRLEVIFSPRYRALMRLIIAERDRFPDLAKMYYERGYVRSRDLLAEYLTQLERRNVLDPGTSDEAAEFVIGMVAHQWILESLLLGGDHLPDTDAIRERAARVVDRFLSAFHRE